MAKDIDIPEDNLVSGNDFLEDGEQEIAPSGRADRYSQAQKTNAFYPLFECKTIYRGNMGLLQAGVAGGAESKARILRKSGPTAQKIVMWKAWRFVEKPTLPHWDTGNANEVLADFLIVPVSPVLIPGGENLLWMCEGLYKYYLYTTPTLNDGFYAAATPLFDATTEQLKVEGYQFSRDLLKSSPPNGYIGDASQFVSLP